MYRIFQKYSIFYKHILQLPVVRHKVVGEVSERKPVGEVGCCESEIAEQIP